MNTSRDILKSIVERVERLNEEIKALNSDKSDIFAEAKSNGFDVKALKVVIQRRAKDPSELTELETIVETYEAELGTGDALRARARTTPEENDPTLKVSTGDATGEMKLSTLGKIAEAAKTETGRKVLAGALAAVKSEEIDLTIPAILDRRSEVSA